MSLGTGLVRRELHAENGFCINPDFVKVLGDFHAAALAASTGVDLGLDHPYPATEFLGNLDRLIDGKSRLAARNRHAELFQDFLALIFVDLHASSLF